MKKILSQVFGTTLLVTSFSFGALGDKINLDLSTTDAILDGVTNGTGWTRLSRDPQEVGALENDLLSSEDDTPLKLSIEAQNNVHRYALKLFSKLNNDASTFSLSVNNAPPTFHTFNTDGSFPQQQLVATYVVTGQPHDIEIINTSAPTWINLDYFLLEEIPAPTLEYTTSITEAVSNDFSGSIGTATITNTNALLGDAATLSLEGDDKEFFSLNSGELSFTTPENPASSYTVTIEANHMGERTTHDITIQVEGGNGGENTSVILLPKSLLQTVDVYDLNGNIIRTSVNSTQWNSELAQGIYLVRWTSISGIAEQKMAIVP